MTNKEKQIEEIKRLVSNAIKSNIDVGFVAYNTHIDFATLDLCNSLVKEGYRKESEVVKEVLTEMYEYLQKECGYSKYDYEIRELVAFAEKYGVKLEVEEYSKTV